MRLKVTAGRKWTSQAFVWALLVVGLSGAAATELQGADAVLQAARTAEAHDPGANLEPTVNQPELAKFQKSLLEKAGELHQMPPEEAARQWYQLLLEYFKLEDRSKDTDRNYPSMRDVRMTLFMQIPGPDSWRELQRLASENLGGLTPVRQAALLTLFARLREDDTGVSAGLKLLEKAFADEGKVGTKKYLYQSLEYQFRPAELTTGSAVDRFTAQIRKHSKETSRWLSVPDLLAVSDEATAKKLLAEAMFLPNTELQFNSANKTLALAKQVALENIDKFKKPRWDLVSSLDSLPLYEPMEEKFAKRAAPKKKESGDPADALLQLLGGSKTEKPRYESELGSSKVKAQVYHYLDLVIAGRGAQADQVFVSSKPFLNSLRSAIRTESYRFPESVYRNLLEKADGDAAAFEDFWVSVEYLARQNSDLPAFAERLKSTMETSGTAAAGAWLPHKLGQVYFALNQSDDAVYYLLKASDSSSSESQEDYDAHEALRLVLKAGKALNRQDYVDKAIEALQQRRKASGNLNYESFSRIALLIEALLDQGRLAEAEEVCKNSLVSAVAQKKDPSGKLSDQLYWLAKIYHKAGRSTDVIKLLDEAPWWGKVDLNDLISSSEVSFSLGVAQAFSDAGRGAEAEKLLKKSILGKPSADGAYDLLTSLTGTASLPWLERLAARDPFEERPLIWKAVVLHRAGDLQGAEEAARLAMKVDPTDGEQPKGQRLLSYKVLADILADAGQTSEAQTLKRIVAAVRLAEQGDELNEIGLADQAIEIYRKASADFADAYCVEWRLARRLQEQGDDEGAQRHYEKAFQMMPNQFGRLANLCFGCEQVFTAGLSQSVAERVLQQIASEPDPKPTVFDLLGQLRQAQGNYVEAARYFKKAADMDPSYFDAWQHLWSISDEAFLSPDETKAVAVRLVELDPFLRHYRGSSKEVPPVLLWRAGERNREWGLEQMQDIYPLKASQERFKHDSQNGSDYFFHKFRSNYWDDWRGPGTYLRDTGWFPALINLLDTSDDKYRG